MITYVVGSIVFTIVYALVETGVDFVKAMM